MGSAAKHKESAGFHSNIDKLVGKQGKHSEHRPVVYKTLFCEKFIHL